MENQLRNLKKLEDKVKKIKDALLSIKCGGIPDFNELYSEDLY